MTPKIQVAAAGRSQSHQPTPDCLHLPVIPIFQEIARLRKTTCNVCNVKKPSSRNKYDKKQIKIHVEKIRTPCNQISLKFTLPLTYKHLGFTAKVSARLLPSQFNYCTKGHCWLWNVYYKPQCHVLQGVRWSLTAAIPSLPAWFATGTPSSTRTCIG